MRVHITYCLHYNVGLGSLNTDFDIDGACSIPGLAMVFSPRNKLRVYCDGVRKGEGVAMSESKKSSLRS